MSRLDEVIKQTKKAQTGEHRPWIFDENGNISDNAIVADSLEFIKNLKPYEINVTDEWIEKFRKGAECYYTYNYGSSASHDIVIWYKGKLPIALICLHLAGDQCRGYFSDFFAVKMEDRFYDDMVCTLSTWADEKCESVAINDHLAADVSLFRDTYNVYDYEKQEDIGTYYELDKEVFLEELAENAKYEMTYEIRGYFDGNMRGLAESISVDTNDAMIDHVHSYCSNGDYVKVFNNRTGANVNICPDEWMESIELGDVPEYIKSF